MCCILLRFRWRFVDTLSVCFKDIVDIYKKEYEKAHFIKMYLNKESITKNIATEASSSETEMEF